MLPRPPYRIEPLDTLGIVVPGAEVVFPKQPIAGKYTVSPDGTINLGANYGSVQVAGMSLQQAQEAIQRSLTKVLTSPQATVTLESMRIMQQTRGNHLVRPDGTIGLGTYGCVYVAGLTIGEVKCKIEEHLRQWVQDPQVSVDIFAYNSKFYYVIFDGGGYGQQVLALPSTGNETVLDAIAKLGGLPPVASKHRIWVARPSPCHSQCDQILPVDWNALTQGGSTCTNYQLLPGDRVYVDADCLIKASNYIAKTLDPIERIFGGILLGQTTVLSFRTFHNDNNNNNGTVFVP
jgi:protein involved in polysaccharide export with SLBB domain